MRTENILEAIQTTLNTITSVVGDVQREQSYDLLSTSLPHLIIYEGEDTVESENSQAYIDWSLTVDIDILTAGESDAAITAVNTLRGEIHAKLMADYTLGLGYVKYIRAASTERPTISVEGDKPIARQRITYEVKYRTNWNSFT